MEMVYERVLDFWVLGSEFSPAAGKKTAYQIEEETFIV